MPTANVNTTWIWNMSTNTWRLLATSNIRPTGRQHFAWYRINHTRKFILVNGQYKTSSITNDYLSDVWIFDLDTLVWQQLTVTNVPRPIRSTPGYVLISNKWLFMVGAHPNIGTPIFGSRLPHCRRQVGGDIGMDNDTCVRPSACIPTPNPSNSNFFLEIKADQLRAQWKDAMVEYSVPYLTRLSMLVMKPYVYAVGGFDWSNKIGQVYNPYTWAIRLNDEYIDLIR